MLKYCCRLCPQCVLGICLIIPSDLGLLIDIFIFASWLFYGWTTLSLLILRYKEPNLHRPYKVSVTCFTCMTPV
jgi:amino acid transporter